MRVSVITVTLNAEQFLLECLESVSAQGDALCEHIIVDGGSTDSTLYIVKKHAANDSRVSWISEPDKGIADAMNKGLRMAKGEIVCFLHADDYLYEDTVLETVSAEFRKHQNLSWLTGGIRLVNVRGMDIGSISVRRFTYNRLLRGNIILHPATFVLRQAMMAIGGFDLKLRYAMDYDLWLRLGANNHPLCLDKLLSCFRIHNGSLSSSKVAEAFAEEKRIRYEMLTQRPLLRILYGCYDVIKTPLAVWAMKQKLRRYEA